MARSLSLAITLFSLALLTPSGAMAADDRPPFPASGAYFGASVGKQEDGTLPVCRDSDPEDGRTLFELCAGSELYLDRVYTGWNVNRWGQPWPSPYDTWSRDQGRRLFISFKPVRADGSRVTWTDIAAGRVDAEIDAQARKIRDFGAPIYLAFHPEPEFSGTTSRFGTHADFRAAWRRVVTRYRAVGATNVRWVLTLMAWTFEPGSGRNPADYYAGASYVDAIGVDGFNYYDCRAASPVGWKSFGQVFHRPYNWVTARGEPMLVAESGSVEDPAVPGRKAQWIRDMAAWVQTKPNVRGVTYSHFHDLIPEQQRDCDWTVDSSTESLLAFRDVVSDPYFTPTS
jgi:hypothetical protein